MTVFDVRVLTARSNVVASIFPASTLQLFARFSKGVLQRDEFGEIGVVERVGSHVGDRMSWQYQTFGSVPSKTARRF